MRIGLIARADARGLGVQTRSFHDHMNPAKTMVIDCPSAKPLPLRRDWYPDATWVHGLPNAGDFRTWLQGLDVVYTAETGYSQDLWSEAERAGVKTVLHLNYEFLDRKDQPTLWAAPSMWRFDEIPFTNKAFLPVPIETHRFTPNTACEARRFLHVVGRPATRDRNGTQDLLQALQHVQSDIELTITCQEPGYVEQLLQGVHVPGNVNLVTTSGDAVDYWELYRNQDVMVLPRRFGGLCLPVNEALGAGMPVIMPHIDPNWWLPGEWLVSAHKVNDFWAKTHIDVYAVDPMVLTRKIDRFAQDAEFFQKAQRQARELADSNSWDALKPQYKKVFEELSTN